MLFFYDKKDLDGHDITLTTWIDFYCPIYLLLSRNHEKKSSSSKSILEKLSKMRKFFKVNLARI